MNKRIFVTALILSYFFISPNTLMAQKRNMKDRLISKKIEKLEKGVYEVKIGQKGIEKTGTKISLGERMDHYKVPGVSIAVINNNKIEWIKAYGSISADNKKKTDTLTMFQAASTSKFITAVIVLHFMEKGILEIDKDVNEYLKSWKMPESEFTKDKKVTLRNLLTHQSGLPTTNFGYDEKMGIPTLIQVLKGELPAKNKPAEPKSIPGSKWTYSNIGYVLIQQILEDVLGKPFKQIAKETIFEPLGMKSSTFEYPLPPNLKENEALPHDDKGIPGEPQMHPTAFAHGGMMTTPKDLAIFTLEIIRSYQGKSNKILSKVTVKKLLHKELDLDPRMFGIPLGEGLGVLLRGEGKKLQFTHPGSNLPGTNCWLTGYPEPGKGAIIMTNGTMGEVLMWEILYALEKEYGWPEN